MTDWILLAFAIGVLCHSIARGLLLVTMLPFRLIDNRRRFGVWSIDHPNILSAGGA